MFTLSFSPVTGAFFTLGIRLTNECIPIIINVCGNDIYHVYLVFTVSISMHCFVNLEFHVEP
jgi:hypothetical protein